MNRRTTFKMVGAGSLVAAGAHALAGPNEPALVDAVARANADWLMAMKSGDAATIAAPYADKGVFVFPDGSTIVGREAIEQMYRSRFEKRGHAVSTSIDSNKLETDGDLACEWGSAKIVLGGSDGKPVVAGGRYLTVWQRQPDAQWKIVRNLVF